MVALAGHVVEARFLDKLSTGPSSDLHSATLAAEDYVGGLAMGPTKIIIPMKPNEPPIGPVIVGAHELLDQLYEETDRLLHEKEPAIHHLANALIERDELIGDELEEVFAEVEAAHPKLLEAFERQLLRFRDFAPMPPSLAEAWTPPPTSPGEGQEEVPAARIPGMDPSTDPPWATRPRL